MPVEPCQSSICSEPEEPIGRLDDGVYYIVRKSIFSGKHSPEIGVAGWPESSAFPEPEATIRNDKNRAAKAQMRDLWNAPFSGDGTLFRSITRRKRVF